MFKACLSSIYKYHKNKCLESWFWLLRNSENNGVSFTSEDIVLQPNEKRSGKIIKKKPTDLSCALL